jgi:hypothetical protein
MDYYEHIQTFKVGIFIVNCAVLSHRIDNQTCIFTLYVVCICLLQCQYLYICFAIRI